MEIYERFINDEDFYYTLRNFDRNPNFYRTDKYFRSARFIFLNKCAFGACRFNQKGQANQSYFKHPERPVFLNEEDLYELHYLLKNTEIKLASFDETIEGAQEGDVVYLDPPYIDSRYDQYWIEKFKHSDIKTLKTHCDRLNEKGVYFILSHSSNEFVFQLYQEYNIVSLNTARNIKWQNRDFEKFDGEFIITNITQMPEFEETKEVINIMQVKEGNNG